MYHPGAVPIPAVKQDQIPEIVDIADWAIRQSPNPPYSQSKDNERKQQENQNQNQGDNNQGDNAQGENGQGDDSQGDNTQQKRQEPSGTESASAAQSSSPSTAHNGTNPAHPKWPHYETVPAKNNTQLPDGTPIVEDAAAGDPPSLGMAVWLTSKALGEQTKLNNVSYHDAVQRQVDYLLYQVPRAPNGAISHRRDEVQLWADNVYMVPPFLAYYGVDTKNKTLVAEAYNQVKQYRAALRHEDNNLWQHIIYNDIIDDGLWGTGNAWAAAGIVRVIATIQQSQFKDEMKNEINDMKAWAEEILKATRDNMSDKHMVRNYVNNASSFEDSCATALIAATGLRMSTLNLTNDYVEPSLQMLAAASRNVNDEGYLTHVTNPQLFKVEGENSPEGQTFMILAYSAYKDWVAQGKQGAPKNHQDHPLEDSSAVAARVGLAGTLAAVAFSASAMLLL